MGRPKAFVEVRGERLIDHVVRVARAVADQVLLVSADPKGFGSLELPILSDERPGLGPLEALRVGLGAAGGERVYAFSCDLPNIEEAPLRQFPTLLGEGDAVIPKSVHGLEPLCALYRRGCVTAIAAELERGERSIHRALRGLRAVHPSSVELGVSDAFFANLNTPADVAALGS